MIIENNKHNVIGIMSRYQVADPEGLGFKPDSENFDFIKILAQIVNNFSKFWQNKK